MGARIIAASLACACALASALARAQDHPSGGLEVADALAVIEDECPSSVSAAMEGAVARINALPERAGADPITLPQTNAYAFLDAYADFSLANPDINERALARAAIDGMARAIDRHSRYLDLTTSRREGAEGAVGLEIVADGAQARIVSALPGSPAERANLKPGDALLAIDGASTEGLYLDEVVALLHGAPGSAAALRIARQGLEEPLVVDVIRDEPHAPWRSIPAIEWRLQAGVGVITIREFYDGSANDLRRAVRELRRLRPAPSGYALDVRDNTGGLLDQVIGAMDLFLDGGRAGHLVGATSCSDTGLPQTYGVRGGDETRGAPLAILTNAATSSGAEIFVATLVERGRARSVGQTTLGRGDVQTVIPLGQRRRERVALKLTTGEWMTPSGMRLSGDGLAPTIPVETSGSERDDVLERALELLAE